MMFFFFLDSLAAFSVWYLQFHRSHSYEWQRCKLLRQHQYFASGHHLTRKNVPNQNAYAGKKKCSFVYASEFNVKWIWHLFIFVCMDNNKLTIFFFFRKRNVPFGYATLQWNHRHRYNEMDSKFPFHSYQNRTKLYKTVHNCYAMRHLSRSLPLFLFLSVFHCTHQLHVFTIYPTQFNDVNALTYTTDYTNIISSCITDRWIPFDVIRFVVIFTFHWILFVFFISSLLRHVLLLLLLWLLPRFERFTHVSNYNNTLALNCVLLCAQILLYSLLTRFFFSLFLCSVSFFCAIPFGIIVVADARMMLFICYIPSQNNPASAIVCDSLASDIHIQSHWAQHITAPKAYRQIHVCIGKCNYKIW